MKLLTQIYTFFVLVVGGAFFGFVVGCVVAFISSLILFYGFRQDLGDIGGILLLGGPTFGGLVVGFNRWMGNLENEVAAKRNETGE